MDITTDVGGEIYIKIGYYLTKVFGKSGEILILLCEDIHQAGDVLEFPTLKAMSGDIKGETGIGFTIVFNLAIFKKVDLS